MRQLASVVRALRRLLLAVLVVPLLAGSVVALAYWTTFGTGSASAGVGTLAAPTGVTATASAGVSTVQVAWTGVTSPLGGAVDGYYVQRFAGTTPSAACGSSLITPVSSTSCNDTNVVVGTYTYKVTTVFRSWTAVSSPSGAVSVTAPTVTVAAISATPTNTQPITYSVTFSEPVSDLAAAGVTVTVPAADTGVTKSVAKTDSRHFTVSVSGLKTDGTGDGAVSVSVNAGAVSDAAGNANLVSNTAGVTWDRTVPTVTVAAISSSPTNTQPLTYAVTFSEPVTDLAAGGVTVTAPAANTGVSKSVGKTDSQHFTVSVSGLKTDGTGDGAVSVSVNASAVNDLAGNASTASNTASVTWDRTVPTVTVAATSSSPTNTQPLTYAVTFSEPVTDLAAGGVTVTAPAANTGVSKSVSKTDSQHFTVSVSGLKTDGTGDGAISVSVNASAVNDLAGNASTVSNTASVTWDRTPPTVTVAATSSSPTNTQPLTYAVTFSEPVTDLAAGGVTVTVPAANTGVSKSVSKTDSQHFTVSVSGLKTDGTGDGAISVSVNASAVNDLAGNASTASNTASVTWDRTTPTLVSLQMLDTNGNGKVDRVTATFSETLAGYTAGTAPWTLANVPSGGSLSSVSVSGAVATLTLTEGAGAADTSVGTFTVALATSATGIRDAAGNLSSFAATAPSDAAAPALLSLQMFDTNANGRVDQVKATFSETLAASTATAPWTLANVPSAGSLSSVSVSGAVATLTLTEGAGAADTSVGSFTVALATNASGIRDAAGNQSSFAATAPVDKATPVLVSLQMFDTNANGKVDQVQATFSESLAAYTAGTAPWTLANVPSAGSLSSVSVSGAVATLTLTEGAGAADTSVGSFTVALATSATGIRDAADNRSSFAATAPVDKAAPALISLQMFDTNANGKVDQVQATFSESLAAYTAGTAPWTLANVPSAGSLSSVSVSGAVATLTLTEGAGAADTSVGSFTVALATSATGIRDAAGNQSSFAATAPVDKATPVLVSLQMFDTNANGKVDQVQATFSETLAAYTAGTAPWTLANVPSAGSLSSVSVSGAVATLTLTEGAGAPDTSVGTFTVALATSATGIRDAAGNQSSFAATAPVDKAAPALISLQMFDTNANGKVDQVKATFSETLAAYTAGTAPWTLANVPSAGSLSSVSVSGTVATLTLTEGAGAADTSVGSFTIALATSATGIRDAAGNQSSYAATAPADKAPPVLISATSGGGTPGQMENADTLTLTFSEPLAAGSVPGSATVMEKLAGGSSQLTIPTVIQAATINNSYLQLGLLGNSAQGTATGTITLTNANKTISIALSSFAQSGNGLLGAGGVGQGTGSVTMSPVGTITDPATNGAVTTSSAAVARLF